MTNRNRGKHIKHTTKHGDAVIHAPPPGEVSAATPIPTRKIPMQMPAGTRITFWQSNAYIEFPAGSGAAVIEGMRKFLDYLETQMRYFDPPMVIQHPQAQQPQQVQALPPAQPGVATHPMVSQTPPQGRPKRATPVETSPDCVHFGNLCSGIHCMCPCGCKQKGPFVAGVPHESVAKPFVPSPGARPNRGVIHPGRPKPEKYENGHWDGCELKAE